MYIITEIITKEREKKLEQEIIVNDINLALLLRNTLEKSGNRDPKFNQLD